MCGNIKKLRFSDRPATQSEIDAAVLQYIRKISNIREPTGDNRVVFERAHAAIVKSVTTLLMELKSKPPRTLRTAKFESV